MTKQELINWALRHDYHFDNYGHLQKRQVDLNGNERKIRLKLSSIAVRKEIQVTHIDYNGKKERNWVRLRSGYYSKLSLNTEDKLVGLTY